MVSNAQMIITNWGGNFACSVSSPQLPGIVAAFDGHPEPAVILGLAREAGLDADGTVDIHDQSAYCIGERQYFIRVLHDYNGPERNALGETLTRDLHNDPSLRDYLERDRFEDAVLVATLPDDRIARVMAGAEADQPLTIGVRAENGTVEFVGLLDGDRSSGRKTLAELGLDHSATIGELMRRLGSETDFSHHQHSRILAGA